MSDAIERRYRRLMFAYPGRYRRTHGAEIVTTLVEMAGDGESRPSAAESWHLLLGGIRQRFRLPARRPLVLIAALLIMMIGGAFGAAAGAWTASRTFTGLPGDAQVAALTRQVVGGGGADFATDRSSSGWTDSVWGAVNAPGWTAEPARQRLAADGWRLGEVLDLSAAGTGAADANGEPVRILVVGKAFDATRDGMRLRVTGYNTGAGTVTVSLRPAGTAALTPVMVAGGLLGMAAGWLIAAAWAYRLRGLPAGRRRVATALSGTAVAALGLPAFSFSLDAARAQEASGTAVTLLHEALDNSPYWRFATPQAFAASAIAGVLLAGAAWLVATRRGEPGAATERVPTAG